MRQTFDGERAIQSIARLKHSGHVFEIVIDPDEAMNVRRGTGSAHDAMLAPHIYSDARSGALASTDLLQELFKTTDEYELGKRIILEGELHFNEEYKSKLREEKKHALAVRIAAEAADPNTGLPLGEARVVSAIAKIHIDLFKSVEEQLPEVIEKIKPYLPLTMETKTVSLRVPSQFAPKLYGFISSKSRIIEQAWMGDGALSAKVELSAGAVAGFLDELKKATKGNLEAAIEKKAADKKR